MHEQRLLAVEKEMAAIREVVHPLVSQMRESTNAMTKLTNEISLLVQSNTYMQKAFDESKVSIVENRKRISSLEKAEEVRKAGDAVILWIKRTIIVGLVAAVLGLVVVK